MIYITTDDALQLRLVGTELRISRGESVRVEELFTPDWAEERLTAMLRNFAAHHNAEPLDLETVQQMMMGEL